MQKIVGQMLKAIKEFNLIERGDKIAVGVSGGKDSLILLEGLGRIKKFLNFNINLVSITIELSKKRENLIYYEVEKICKKYGIERILKCSTIYDIVFNVRKEKNPCSLCSKLKKGILNNIAKEKGCNKVAFGHHLDDVVETFIMNLFSEGRISCFSPNTFFSRQNLFLIRPLVFIEENYIKKVCENFKFDVVKNFCNQDGNTYRQVIKNFLKDKEKNDKGFKKRIFNALRKSGINGWGYNY